MFKTKQNKKTFFFPLGRFFFELKLARAICNTWCVTHGWMHALKKNLCLCSYKCMNITGVLAHVCFSQLLVIKEWMEVISIRIATRRTQLFISTRLCGGQARIWQLDLEHPGVGMLVGFWNAGGRTISCPIADVLCSTRFLFSPQS